MRRRRWWELAAILLIVRYYFLGISGDLDQGEVPILITAVSCVLAGMLLRWRFRTTGTVLVVAGAMPGLFVLWEGARSVALLSLVTIIWVLDPRVERIGRLLSPVISYALLTAGLVGVYVFLSTQLGGLLGAVVGGSHLAVAGLTLVVAALFGAPRRRVQGLVDRYFNRARYDAQRDMAALRARLHHRIKPEEAAAELLASVQRTVDPAFASVWLSGSRQGIHGSSRRRHDNLLPDRPFPQSWHVGGHEHPPVRFVDQLRRYVASVRTSRHGEPSGYRPLSRDWKTIQMVGDLGTRERKTGDSPSG